MHVCEFCAYPILYLGQMQGFSAQSKNHTGLKMNVFVFTPIVHIHNSLLISGSSMLK